MITKVYKLLNNSHYNICRFLPPIPKKPWSGVKDVRKVANSCVQIKGTAFGNFSGEQVISIILRFCESLLTPSPNSKSCVWWTSKSEAPLSFSDGGIVPDTFWPLGRMSCTLVGC